MQIEIRKALPGDFEEVHKLIMKFATFIKTPEKVQITPEQMIKDQKLFKCLVATNENEIIGFATYFFSYYSWTGKAIYLDDLYVKDDYRGKGIGSSLFNKVMKIGKEENCFKMRWQVSNWNDKAQEFYKSKGASIDNVEVNCDLALD